MKFCRHQGIHYVEISLHFSVSCISKSFPVKKLKIRNRKNFEKFYTRVVVTVRITIFWDVTPCSLVEMQQCFRGTCCPKDGSGRSLHSITSQKTVITNNNFFLDMWYSVSLTRTVQSFLLLSICISYLDGLLCFFKLCF